MLSVLREVSIDELRDQAERPPRLLIVGPNLEQTKRLSLALTGEEGQFATFLRTVEDPLEALDVVDAAVVWDPEGTGASSRVAEALRFTSPPVPVIRFEGTSAGQLWAVEQARADIVKRIPERAPALGRALPAFRAAATKQILDETAGANAQFSFVSNIPSVIPVVGSIAAAGADFIILTKNQVMMLYKLAAVHGRNLHDQRGILQEVLPVVGAGLLWRTLAREAVSLLPFAAGTIPKVAIAYFGTIVVGRAAEYYYRTGLRPTAEQMDQFRRQAVERMQNLGVFGIRQRMHRDSPDHGGTWLES
jgi:uncharacterized protein (DUF697 family)